MAEEQLKLKLKSIDFGTLRFAPKSNISTFELAQALMVLVPYRNESSLIMTIEEAFYRLPREVRRHFKYKTVQR
jgi:hypothetical protein